MSIRLLEADSLVLSHQRHCTAEYVIITFPMKAINAETFPGMIVPSRSLAAAPKHTPRMEPSEIYGVYEVYVTWH